MADIMEDIMVWVAFTILTITARTIIHFILLMVIIPESIFMMVVNSVPYGRRERQSNLSSKWNSIAGSGSSRRDSYLSTGGSSNVYQKKFCNSVNQSLLIQEELNSGVNTLQQGRRG